jgi:alanine dehydrogenase
VSIWNRSAARAEVLAKELSSEKFSVDVARDAESAVRNADIISCATLSTEPLVHGAWLKAGAHLDLVGAFRPTMREADDDAVKRARVYVDTRRGALKEAGDLVQPMERGLFREQDVAGDLFDLCRGTAKGRAGTSEITLFKSVGTAIEDLAAAMLVWRKLG